MNRRLIALSVVLAACPKPEPEDSDTATEWAPDLACPGDAGCEEGVATDLLAGAAKRSIVPDCYETWTDLDGDWVFDRAAEAFLDCGCDRLCPGDQGYVAADEFEGDGQFRAVYIGGGDNSRPVMGVRDPEMGLRGEGDGVWVRTIALRQGNTTVALAALDILGLQYDDTLRIREEAATRGIDVDHIITHSTHSHLAVDSIGLWGPTLTRSGYDDAHMAQVRTAVVDSIADAIAALEPVTVSVGEVDVESYSAEKGVGNVIRDSRDPVVIDNILGAVRFVGLGGDTVATLVSYGIHPETMLDRTAFLSSDFVHGLRETVESGVEWDSRSRDGIGGVCVYVNSTVGGMMTTLGVTTIDPDGNTWGSSGSWEKTDAIGQQLGEMALDAIEDATPLDAPLLSVKTTSFFLPIENQAFQAMGLIGVLERTQYNYDPEQTLSEENQPDVRTEIDVLEIGGLQLVTMPGEILPEIAIGGYDGSHVHTPGLAIVDLGATNPPDVSLAPPGPYLKDEMTGTWRWIVGLGNDEIGYVIPEYDFELDDGAPYVNEADGDHYEETRSLGPTTGDQLAEHMRQLIGWTRQSP